MTDASPSPVPGPDLSWASAQTDPAPLGYAPWWRRAAGAVVDVLVTFAVYLLGVALTLLIDPDGTAEPPTVAGVVVVAGAVLIPVVWIWNRGAQQGGSGRSLGRSLAGTRLVSAETGQPIGAGPAWRRDIAHLLDLPLLVGFLWPLWDRRRQTFADKNARTVVLRDARHGTVSDVATSYAVEVEVAVPLDRRPPAPSSPEDLESPVVRAGAYAEVDGVTYAAVSLDGPTLRLVAFGDDQPFPGFEYERWDRWSRLVDRSAASRLFWVESTATWSGKTVVVELVEGDRAEFSYAGVGLPLDNPAVERTGQFEWQGTVPVGELTEVVEVVTEVPL